MATLSDMTEAGRRAEPGRKYWINSFITILWDVAHLLKSMGSPTVSYVVREEKQFGGWSRGGPVCTLTLLGRPSSGPQASSCWPAMFVLRMVGVRSVRRRDGVTVGSLLRSQRLRSWLPRWPGRISEGQLPPVTGPWGAVTGTPAEAWRMYSVHREPLLLWTLKLGFVAASPA